MESMLLPVGAALLGLVLLVWGADRFVDGAAATARNFGISPLVVGLVIVGFGTSAPEMLVSAVAAWQGNTGISIGNAVGSNITNIALILGVAALVRPLQVHSAILRRELPVLLAAMLVALLLLLDGALDRVDGAVLMSGFAISVYWTISLALRGRNKVSEPDALASEFEAELASPMSTGRALFWVFAGLVLLLVSSRLLVWGATELARAMGISDLVIGLTVVAIGTSLPELAASVSAALKNEHDIAIGNVIGSNTFNILAVMGLPGLIHPGVFDPALLHRDFPVMIGLTLALFAMAYGIRGEGRINRLEGVVLLLTFVGYQWLLFG
jgi:cation:H+ antiporter